jgi:serine/tyrosine/threonine adenylyltransferase
VLTRVAASHLRVGTFEFFSVREDNERLRQLADYAIARHDSDLINATDRHVQLVARVAARQARLIAQWMGVGFIHGVMNTDNMTISGETIDYGPCAFMEAYDPSAVFSSIDHQGRYAFGNQPGIAQWNLARLAQALLPLLHDDTDQAVALATPLIEAFADQVTDERVRVTAAKLGLQHLNPAQDAALMQSLMELMHAKKVDHTLAFRAFVQVAQGHDAPWLDLFQHDAAALDWLAQLKDRWASESMSADQRQAVLRRANPMVIPRNHRVEEALDAATHSDDFVPFERLLSSLKRPFDDRDPDDPDAKPASQAQTASYRTYCGT